WIRLAVISQPPVVGAAHRAGEPRVLDGTGEQAEARIEESGVDPVGIHVDDTGVRVEPAFLSFGVLQGIGFDRALPHTNRAEAADSSRIAQHFALDGEAFLTVLVNG